MTEPTDDELEALAVEHEAFGFGLADKRGLSTHGFDPDGLRSFARAVLAKWCTPVVAKWAPEEIAGGERGIRWVTNEGIHGRPTDHDVREYLKRTPTAHGCHCDECKQFYTTPQPTQAQAGAITPPPIECNTEELKKAYAFGWWSALEKQRETAQAGAVPLDEARRLFDAGWKAAALFCDREDVVADGITGFGACPQFEAAFAAANGIKGGQHG